MTRILTLNSVGVHYDVCVFYVNISVNLHFDAGVRFDFARIICLY